MTILALEFSSPQRSAAVLRGGGAAAPAIMGEVVETGGKPTRAFDMIEAALREAGIDREQIQCLVVGLGPGSYTGIRAAIAIAQGWQLARGIKLLGLSSADAIAAQAQVDGLTGHVGVVIDAQRKEFYLAEYELGVGVWQEPSPLRLITQPELQARIEAGLRPIGPEVTQWFPSGRQVFPRAAMLGGLAGGRADFDSGEKLEPIYLRETRFAKAPKPRVIP